MPIINRPTCLWLSLLSIVPATATAAAPYPIRPIRLISPFAPGGGNDIISRTLGAAVSKGLGQSIVVDNRPGANTIVAMEILARATPDGYTLLTTSSSQATNATLYTKLPYDSIKDFSPVSMVGVSPLVVAVNPALPIRSVNDLIAAAKAKPGSILYPSAGTGNSTHLGGELCGRRPRAHHAGSVCGLYQIRYRQVGQGDQAVGGEDRRPMIFTHMLTACAPPPCPATDPSRHRPSPPAARQNQTRGRSPARSRRIPARDTHRA